MTVAVVTGVALTSVPARAGPAVSPAVLAQPVVVATGLNNPRQLSVSDATRRQLVADAAGNTIIEVRNGQPRVLAVLPDHDGNQSVPTSLAVGRDGTIYVGELNGENPGTARVLKLSPTGALLGHVGGFTTISGVAVGQDGTLHVSELFGGGEGGPPGQVTTVRPNGSRSSRPVPFPAGLALDAGGHLYVAAWSIADADGTELGEPEVAEISPPGQVWRLS